MMWHPLLLFLMIEVNANIPLLPHQLRFIESRTFYTALTGGYGSGKSAACALKGILNTNRDPGLLHGIISPSFPTAKLTIVPSIFEVLEDWLGLKEGDNRDFSYNRVDHYFKIHPWNGHLVILSAENKNKGPTLASCGLDEPGVQPFDSFKQAIARVRHPNAKASGIYMTGTPEDQNWYRDVVEGDRKPNNLTDIRARTRDNIFLPDTYFSNMEESYSREELLAYMEGQFVDLSGSKAHHGFANENVILASEFTPDPSLPLLVGFDYNWFPNTAILAQEVPDWETPDGPAKRLIVFDEVWIRGDTNEKCAAIRGKYGDGYTYRIYQDATGDKNTSVGVSDLMLVQNAFKGTDFRVLYPAANPRRTDRLNAVNGKLCNARGERFILITDNCRHVLDDLRKVDYAEYMSGKYSDPERGHIIDALGYMVHYRYPITRQLNHSNRRILV